MVSWQTMKIVTEIELTKGKGKRRILNSTSKYQLMYWKTKVKGHPSGSLLYEWTN